MRVKEGSLWPVVAIEKVHYFVNVMIKKYISYIDFVSHSQCSDGNLGS